MQLSLVWYIRHGAPAAWKVDFPALTNSISLVLHVSWILWIISKTDICRDLIYLINLIVGGCREDGLGEVSAKVATFASCSDKYSEQHF